MPVLIGTRDSCNVTCGFTPVTSCHDDDGCCAPGCNANNDNDCSAVCGNGVIEGDESCDGDSCNISCSAADSCTVAVTTGSPSTCDVACTMEPVTACQHDDGCCAPGCNANNDNDCAAVCGNGVIEGDESCDGDSCDITCDAPDSCSVGIRTSAVDSCDVACSSEPISACQSDDGCCAPGCTPGNDNDCEPEVCPDDADVQAALCDDQNSCTQDSFVAFGPGCVASCDHVVDALCADIVFPTSGVMTGVSAVTVRGNAASPAGITSVRVGGVTASSTDGFLTWEATLPLSDGHNDFSVELTEGDDTISSGLSPRRITTQTDLPLKPIEVIYAPDGQTLYGLSNHSTGRAYQRDSNTHIFALDLTTGLRRVISRNMLVSPEDFALNAAADTLYVIDSDGEGALLKVRISDGHTTRIATFPEDAPASSSCYGRSMGITLDPSEERAFVAASCSQGIFEVDLETGERTRIFESIFGMDTIGGFSYPDRVDLAYDAVADRLYYASSHGNTVGAISLGSGEHEELIGESTGAPVRCPTDISLTPDRSQLIVVECDADAYDVSARIFELNIATKALLTRINSGPRVGTNVGADLSPDGTQLMQAAGSYQDHSAPFFLYELSTGIRTGAPVLEAGSGPALKSTSFVVHDATHNEHLVISRLGNNNYALFAIAADGTRRVLANLDSTQGELLRDRPFGMAYGARYEMVFVATRRRILGIDRHTGDVGVISGRDVTGLNTIGSGPELDEAAGLVIDHANRYLYTIETTTHKVIEIEVQTGARRVVNPDDAPRDRELHAPHSLAFGPNQQSLFLAESYGFGDNYGDDRVLQIDLGTGAQTTPTGLGLGALGYYVIVSNRVGNTLFTTNVNHGSYVRRAPISSGDWTEVGTSRGVGSGATLTNVADIDVLANGLVAVVSGASNGKLMHLDPITLQRVIVSGGI